MTGSFILDYTLLVFLASCGVFQVAAARNGLRGLLFFRGRRLSILFGLALLVGAFAWFFLSGPRNVPDTAQGMNGNEQFAYFFVGSGAGLAFTLLLSSLRNRALGQGRRAPPAGMDALRQCSYLLAFSRTLHQLLQPRRGRWKRY